MLTEHAPAKINLALHLRRRRPDGYHDLESIFAFTDFGDRLHAAPAETLTLTLSGPTAAAAGPDADNLVLRAGWALAAAAGMVPGAAVTLEKRIPVAAGLGGGSADAAAALRLLNRLWGLNWPLDRLATLAEPLGADVPVLLYQPVNVRRPVFVFAFGGAPQAPSGSEEGSRPDGKSGTLADQSAGA